VLPFLYWEGPPPGHYRPWEAILDQTLTPPPPLPHASRTYDGTLDAELNQEQELFAPPSDKCHWPADNRKR
jgi:hypothetical protein